MNDETSHIATYPVGLLHDIKNGRKFRTMRGYLLYQIELKNWRAVRSYFNGYLAEWHYPPEGVLIHRCGRGWTRKAAIRRLGIHIATVNSPELNDTNKLRNF